VIPFVTGVRTFFGEPSTAARNLVDFRGGKRGQPIPAARVLTGLRLNENTPSGPTSTPGVYSWRAAARQRRGWPGDTGAMNKASRIGEPESLGLGGGPPVPAQQVIPALGATRWGPLIDDTGFPRRAAIPWAWGASIRARTARWGTADCRRQPELGHGGCLYSRELRPGRVGGVGAYSGQLEHRFRRKPNAYSGGSRTPFPPGRRTPAPGRPALVQTPRRRGRSDASGLRLAKWDVERQGTLRLLTCERRPPSAVAGPDPSLRRRLLLARDTARGPWPQYPLRRLSGAWLHGSHPTARG
jgi:hypothetical protein